MNNTAIKVLLIEDNLQDAELIMLMLERSENPGFEVEHVQRLSDGKARINKSRFDLILLDLGLPDSVGMDTLVEMHAEAPGTPIIVLTGLDDQVIAEQSIRFGGQDYLVKGQSDSRLLERSIRYAIERKRVEEALRESEDHYRTLFNSLEEGFCIVEMIFDENENPVDYRFLETNPSFEKHTGLRDAKGKRISELALKHEEHWFETYGKIALTGQSMRFQNRADELNRWFDVYAFRFGRPEKRQVAVLFNDITVRKRMEEEVRQMAYHDALTGLPNRRYLNDVVTLQIAQARRHTAKFAIFFMDLDRFKEVNDTLGHEIGDLLLKEAASRLKAVTRTSDIVARIGGDEFNLLLADIRHPEYMSEVARKVLAAFRKPFMIKEHELNVSTSIGISVFPDDSEKIDELLKFADIAMYYAKEHGRDRFQFYNPVINSRSEERVRFENDLRRAIERDEFRMHFQPLVDIKTGKILSVEALLRWKHPEKGLLLPGQFFEAAEDLGLMPEIDEWVLKNSGKQIKAWLDQGISPLCVTVNVSPREFHNPLFADRVSQIIKETGMEPECLEIEIAEATAMQQIETSIQQVRKLRDMGVHVSIDHFGSGYSSLTHLKRLPVSKLKIDRSFIRDIATNIEDRKIVRAVLLLAHSLDLKVVAEGVEDDDQLGLLRSLQCDEAQGYLFSKPLPAEELKEMVEAA